jgi:hypothetical protein
MPSRRSRQAFKFAFRSNPVGRLLPSACHSETGTPNAGDDLSAKFLQAAEIANSATVRIWNFECLRITGSSMMLNHQEIRLSEFGEPMNLMSRTPDEHDLIPRTIATAVVVLIWWSALAFSQNTSQTTNSTQPISLHANASGARSSLAQKPCGDRGAMSRIEEKGSKKNYVTNEK